MMNRAIILSLCLATCSQSVLASTDPVADSRKLSAPAPQPALRLAGDDGQGLGLCYCRQGAHL